MANKSNGWTAALVLSLLTITPPASLFAQQDEDEVPFELRDRHLIVVKGSLAGLDRKANLLVDTGAVATAVNRKLARKVGLRVLPDRGIKLDAFGSAMKVERVLVSQLGLGRRVITRSCLSAELPWKEIDIVIGLDILRGASLTIDYERSSLVFGRPGAGEAATAFESQEGLVVVPVVMNGDTLRLAVDTGGGPPPDRRLPEVSRGLGQKVHRRKVGEGRTQRRVHRSPANHRPAPGNRHS